MREKAEAVVATGAAVVASGNPGCTIQLIAGLRELGADVNVVHPIEAPRSSERLRRLPAGLVGLERCLAGTHAPRPEPGLAAPSRT